MESPVYDAGYSMLGAGAWGWPREMLWGGRWEGGSCLGTHIRIKDFKIKEKIKNKKIKRWRKKKKLRVKSEFQHIALQTQVHNLVQSSF